MALSCKDQGKQLSTQYYARPNISALEIRSPESVLHETIDPHSAIIDFPPARSPAMQREMEMPTTRVLSDLIVAEKVARRQYDELIMFPELSKFVPDLLYIRNDEHEHEKILECVLQRLGSFPAAQPAAAQPTQLPIINYKGKRWYFDKRLSQIRNVLNPHDFLNLTEDEVATLEGRTTQQTVTLTPQALGEFYETILDRFGEEEEKSVKNYEELLVKVQDSMTALINARMQKNMSMESYQEAIVPLNELQRKINKHLNEERVHLDVIDALQEMFSNMKLGKAY